MGVHDDANGDGVTEQGGGASRSTDPAVGSSSATDVSLREHVSEKIAALDRHLTHEIDALRRETSVANANSDKAITIAADEAAERLKAHNGLIEQMRDQAGQFATREVVKQTEVHLAEKIDKLEAFQAKLSGGLLVVAVIGVANLVKIWSG